jgi:predicted nucleic acid-binding protein
MKTALDTNVISAMWSREPSTPRLALALDTAKRQGTLVLSPPAFAECLAHPFYTEAQIESFFADTGITVDLRLLDDIWALAGRRYRQYSVRRRQFQPEPPRRILADFLVGAHALLQADQLITLDTNFYRTNYPELRLYPIGE